MFSNPSIVSRHYRRIGPREKANDVTGLSHHRVLPAVSANMPKRTMQFKAQSTPSFFRQFIAPITTGSDVQNSIGIADWQIVCRTYLR